MSDRALPDLISRIRVDSTGVDAALLNLIAGVGRAQLALVGLGAAIGLLVIGGKSMVDIAMKEDAAHRGLAQAVDYYNANLGKNTKTHQVWVATAGKARDTAKQLADQQLGVARANEAENVAQAAYTRALYTYGPQSEKTMRAELALENAKQRLAAAQQRVNAQVEQSTGKWVTVAGTQARAKISLEEYQKTIEAFIGDNKAYISDQAEVINGYAQLIRSGLSTREVQLDLNRAVDLSAIKHVSLADAVDLVDQAEHGRYRGLIDLGIATRNYVDAQGKQLTGAKLVAAVMADVDAKTKNGRNTLTDYQKKWNILNNDWQTLSSKGGPVILTLLDGIVTKLTDAYDALDKIGKDDALWGRISDRLVTWGQQIHDFFVSSGLSELIGSSVADFLIWLIQQNGGGPLTKGGITIAPPGSGKGASYNNPADPYGPSRPTQQKARGGSVLPNRTYTVGEDAMETLVMGPRGGYVIPTGSPRSDAKHLTVIVQVQGSVQTERSLHMAVREGIRRLDREHR